MYDSTLGWSAPPISKLLGFTPVATIHLSTFVLAFRVLPTHSRIEFQYPSRLVENCAKVSQCFVKFYLARNPLGYAELAPNFGMRIIQGLVMSELRSCDCNGASCGTNVSNGFAIKLWQG